MKDQMNAITGLVYIGLLFFAMGVFFILKKGMGIEKAFLSSLFRGKTKFFGIIQIVVGILCFFVAAIIWLT